MATVKKSSSASVKKAVKKSSTKVAAKPAVKGKTSVKKTVTKTEVKPQKVVDSANKTANKTETKTEVTEVKADVATKPIANMSAEPVEKTTVKPVSQPQKSQQQKSQPQQNQEPQNRKPEVEIPSLEKFLNSGAHFGHKSSRWNPKMAPYIYEERNGIHIIDIIKSMSMLKNALLQIQDASERGSILIVGTKGQASTAVRMMAEEVGAFYIDTRWPGGLFTNFSIIKKSLEKLMKMEEQLANGAVDLVKKEQLLMERDVQRLNKMYSGIKFMDKLPTLLIVIDSRVEKNAIREARIAGVKSVALIDTNCDPEMIDFPIPANDDSIRSIRLFIELFGEAIKGGRKSEGLIALRRDYELKLANMKKAYTEETEKKRAMEEAEREKLKALRAGKSGKVDANKKVFRMVQKES